MPSNLGRAYTCVHVRGPARSCEQEDNLHHTLVYSLKYLPCEGVLTSRAVACPRHAIKTRVEQGPPRDGACALQPIS